MIKVFFLKKADFWGNLARLRIAEPLPTAAVHHCNLTLMQCLCIGLGLTLYAWKGIQTLAYSRPVAGKACLRRGSDCMVNSSSDHRARVSRGRQNDSGRVEARVALKNLKWLSCSLNPKLSITPRKWIRNLEHHGNNGPLLFSTKHTRLYDWIKLFSPAKSFLQ